MFSIRSERAFCQHLTYNLLFKWFLDLPIDARRSTPPPSPRTGSGCSRPRSPIGSWPRSSSRPSCGATSRASTSASMAPCSRPGPRTRASGPRMTGQGRSSQRGTEPGGRLPRERRSNETHQSTTDPRRGWPQGELGGGQAELRGAPAHGEPQRPDRRHGVEPGDRLRRTDTALTLLRRLPKSARRRTVAGTRATTPATSSPGAGRSG